MARLTAAPCAHDLLALAPDTVLRDATARPLTLPPWAADSISRWPWVVVRRDRHTPQLIGVGIRGPQRSLRLAAWLRRDDIHATLTPADLVARLTAPPTTHAHSAALICQSTLAPLGLRWGPTGSVGFALATGAPAVHPASDLDLLIDTPDPTPVPDLTNAIAAVAADSRCRIDCQLRTPSGLVSLAELDREAATVMVRSEHGTIATTTDPWQRSTPAGVA
jgi:phosphoribosyl-dephospho-CoA transferase